jgi:hypothetical protein
MKQYWMHIKYSEPVRCDNPLWTLTKGAFRSVEAVYKAYEHQAAAMGYKILEVIPVGKRNRLGCWPYHVGS